MKILITHDRQKYLDLERYTDKSLIKDFHVSEYQMFYLKTNRINRVMRKLLAVFFLLIVATSVFYIYALMTGVNLI